ncbi:oleate activated transcription factor [Acrasis kona]|uniref:Oleate activated transcription factor n=1 Tax=Acrasis kona TaxID=1008807 RepID=A0AAW2YZ56_9EUKA
MRGNSTCTNCKRLHRRCDRLLPTCTECKSKGKSCQYPENQKEELTERYTPRRVTHPNLKIGFTHSNLPLPLITLTLQPTDKEFKYIDLFQPISFEMLLFCPHLTSRELSDVLLYLDKQHDGVACQLEAPKWESIAFVYGVLAFYYRQDGNDESAHFFFELCRNLMTQNDFESVSNTFETACCFQYLGLYCMINENELRAKYFLSNVRGYIENQEGKPKHPCFHFMKNFQGMLEFLLEADCVFNVYSLIDTLHDGVMMFAKDLENLKLFYSSEQGRMISCYPEISDVFADIDLVYTREQMLEMLQDFNQTNDLMTHLTNIYSSTFDRMNKILPHPTIYFNRLTMFFVLQVHRFANFIAANDFLNARVVADNVAKLLNSTNFSHCFMIVTLVISVFSDFHIECINQSEDHFDKLLLLASLKEEYAAVSQMSGKYMRAQTEAVKQRIENVLIRYQHLTNPHDFSFSKPTITDYDQKLVEVEMEKVDSPEPTNKEREEQQAPLKWISWKQNRHT